MTGAGNRRRTFHSVSGGDASWQARSTSAEPSVVLGAAWIVRAFQVFALSVGVLAACFGAAEVFETGGASWPLDAAGVVAFCCGVAVMLQLFASSTRVTVQADRVVIRQGVQEQVIRLGSEGRIARVTLPGSGGEGGGPQHGLAFVFDGRCEIALLYTHTEATVDALGRWLMEAASLGELREDDHALCESTPPLRARIRWRPSTAASAPRAF